MTEPLSSEEGSPPLPPSLQWLKALVMTLTLVMIIGVIAMVWVFVTRFPKPDDGIALDPAMIARLDLPQTTQITAVTLGQGWIALVDRDANGQEAILIFDAETGALVTRAELPKP